MLENSVLNTMATATSDVTFGKKYPIRKKVRPLTNDAFQRNASARAKKSIGMVEYDPDEQRVGHRMPEFGIAEHEAVIVQPVERHLSDAVLFLKG